MHQSYEDRLRTAMNQLKEIQKAIGNEKIPLIKDLCATPCDGSAILYLLLNPFATFGIGEKSLTKQIDLPVCVEYENLGNMLNDLQRRNGITDRVIRDVQNFIASLPDQELRSFVSSVVTKTFTIGATAKTVNKAVGTQFIPTFECMLANKYFDNPDVVIGKKFSLTLKMDGIRCIMVKDGFDIKFFTRQGQRIYGMTELEQEARAYDGSVMFDGELLVTGGFDMDSKDAYKATTKIVRKDGEKINVDYHVFDVLHKVEYDKHLRSAPYAERRARLDRIASEMCHVFRHIQILPVLYSGDDISQIQKHLDTVRSLNQEGIMINLNDARYAFSRTNALLKVKVMQDCDLMITGVQEGTGRFKGTLGSLVVDYKGNPVGVGSGLSDEMRHAVWSYPNDFIGRVATIQYFEETQDKDGKLSIRFPVFKEIRENGKEVSYS